MRLATRSTIGRIATLACALAIAGAATMPAAADSITDKVGGWLFGKSSPPPAGSANPSGPAADIDCPSVTVRQGAATLAITEPGAESGPMTTRYQVSISQTARECAVLGGMMTIKVGVEGRVLLGPMGGPGDVDIPLRVAVVQEGTTPKTIVSKFYKVPVTVPPGQTSVQFVQVDQDLSFPTPRGSDLDNYIVYVGFDPQSLGAKPERKAKPKPKHK
jgi:hypothetical protein